MSSLKILECPTAAEIVFLVPLVGAPIFHMPNRFLDANSCFFKCHKFSKKRQNDFMHEPYVSLVFVLDVLYFDLNIDKNRISKCMLKKSN